MAARLEDMDEVALAAAAARARSDPGSCAVVLVEGLSDQAAVQTLAERAGRDLRADGIFVVAMGGATNIGHFVSLFGPGGYGARLAGLGGLGAGPGCRRAPGGCGPGR